jgi:hypothetical protein
MVIGAAHLSPLLSILFGILILVFPRLLNYLVAIYLILAGLLGIGLIGRPLHARAQFEQLAPAAATPVCRPAASQASGSSVTLRSKSTLQRSGAVRIPPAAAPSS